jgi:ABC-type phosphate transport system permease subunit
MMIESTGGWCVFAAMTLVGISVRLLSASGKTTKGNLLSFSSMAFSAFAQATRMAWVFVVMDAIYLVYILGTNGAGQFKENSDKDIYMREKWAKMPTTKKVGWIIACYIAGIGAQVAVWFAISFAGG